MKLLYVCSVYFKDSPTGAGTQVRETKKSLERLGVSVLQIFVKLYPLSFEDNEGKALNLADVRRLASENDVAHIIHCSRDMMAAWRKVGAKIPVVGSTIFWGGLERVGVAWQTYPLGISRFKTMFHFFRSMMPLYQDFRGVSVFLPNSCAEADCVRRCFRHDSDALFVPVPNGFVPPSFDVRSLPKSDKVPFEDYIVVPGIFANRKNQLGLIKALRNTNYKVVFLGGFNLVGSKPDRYYQECSRLANGNMLFLGYISSSSREYWQILAHATCACLSSDCETPGIAMIEAAYAGARPVITKFGGTQEYYGFDGEYFDPRSEKEIANAINRGWLRGRLSVDEASEYCRFSWDYCARVTKTAYEMAVSR